MANNAHRITQKLELAQGWIAQPAVARGGVWVGGGGERGQKAPEETPGPGRTNTHTHTHTQGQNLYILATWTVNMTDSTLAADHKGLDSGVIMTMTQ